MKFSDIYSANVKAVKSSLTSLWCSESAEGKQKAYADQLKELIDKEIFSSEEYMPLVQSMEYYESSTDEQASNIFKLIDKNLWRRCIGGKEINPYLHQVKAWESLTDSSCRSMVVTTGTGSGKTECFMIPLVNELKQNQSQNQTDFHSVKAIFLYPLNALMEDQKERLQRLLDGSGLKFAVYNGNLPDQRNDDNRAQIKLEKDSYKNIVPTRADLHRDGADIILTNPTMLEYMLIRDKDQKLFTPGTLRWIVVDEAHTFTGAAAAELALLMRRLNNAFQTDLDKLHFAASSATIGNGEEKERQEQELKEFISRISNISSDKIDVIPGKRVPFVRTDDTEWSKCKEALSKSDCDYVKLSDLIEGNSIQERLVKLDQYCDQGLRAKVHFFYRAANNGVRVQLDDWADQSAGLLKLQTKMPMDPSATPALEVMRCKCCGEYMAFGEYTDDHYCASTNSSDDMFDFSGENLGESGKVFFGVVNTNKKKIDDNEYISIEGDTYRSGVQPQGRWALVANRGLKCPHCGAELVPSNGKNNDEEFDVDESMIRATRLRVSAEFLSRLMAPSLLDCLRTKDNIVVPHHGQQYLSFVDSRQAAAQSTLKQNVEVEKKWVYGSVFHKLLDLNKQKNITHQIEKLQREISDMENNGDFGKTHGQKSQQLYNLRKQYPDVDPQSILSWSDIFNHLKSQPECDALCKLFVNRTKGLELDENGDVNPVVRNRYVHAIMLSYLTQYPPFHATAETMGLFCSHYKKLDEIRELPDAVKKFADKHQVQIELDQWKDLLHIFLDRDPRSNESFFLKTSDPNIDLFNCSRRFGFQRPPHRTIRKPWLNDECTNARLIHYLIAKWINPDNDFKTTIQENREDINNLMNALWVDLTQKTSLLQPSERIKKDADRIDGSIQFKGDWGLDHDTPNDSERYPSEQLNEDGLQYRLNVADIGFELPEKVYYCTIQERNGIIKHVRPIYKTFMGYAPYMVNGDFLKPLAEENWDVLFPYINGNNDGKKVDETVIESWLRENRSKMEEYGLTGERGCFTDNIISILKEPVVFLQAEHTAQVDKKTSKESQSLFKNQQLNILACSTTMEMGVDLGNLELVMMTSIPPHPANYKQRAGRSGRNDAARSISITLCPSDAVGLRVLTDPMSTIIKRRVKVPFVDLDCPTIIQRHVNAFLYRQSNVFFDGDANRSSLNWKLVDIFSPYHFKEKERLVNGRMIRYTSYWDLEEKNDRGQGSIVYPKSEDPLEEGSDTRYERFSNWLLNVANPIDISFLLNGTSEEGRELAFLNKCHAQWKEKYEDIQTELMYYGRLYKEAYEDALNNGGHHTNVDGKLETPYGSRLIRKYNNILAQRLIEYLATHRFTPNANMPVNIVTFEVNNSDSNRPWIHVDNPSYPLQQALSQYAPGNMIVKENRILKVAGVEYYGNDSNHDPLHYFNTDGRDVVHSESRRTIPMDEQVLWRVNGRKDLGMVRVKKFIPDVNAKDSRMIEPAPYTRVNAQLVGAKDWEPSMSHLMSTRCNLNAGEAKILYYNEGLGYGYCLCPQCGKMELETYAVGNRYYENVPSGMTYTTNNPDSIPCHYSITRTEDDGKPKICIPKNNRYSRNVIIGDLIQTDFCEMRIKKTDGSFTTQTNDKSLLTTLGILFCRVFTELIGKDRQSVDFTIVPNGNLCIFDTNPGGSGYSNQLDDSSIMIKVVENALAFLKAIDSKEALLDKFTLRHQNDLDVESARVWLEAEIGSWETIPQDVEGCYRNAQWSGYNSIITDFKHASDQGKHGVVFCADNYDQWNYESVTEDDDEYKTWKVRMQKISVHYGIHKAELVITTFDPQGIPSPAKNMLRKTEWWCDVKSCSPFMNDGFYPLAIVNGKLYFTNQAETATMDGNWAKGNVFWISNDIVLLAGNCQQVDLAYHNTMCNIEISSNETKKIYSHDLAGVVLNLSKQSGVDLSNFFDYCTNSNQEVKITYQDEHLKSVVGMITTIQFIECLLTKMGRTNNFKVYFVNEEYYESTSEETTNPAKNIETYRRRNKILQSLMDEWVRNRTNCAQGEEYSYWSNYTRRSKTLPHWRILTIECGNKKVNIYPNGGIINEWFVDFYADSTKSYLMTDDVTTNIALYRRSPILYTIEVCE